MNDYTLTKVCSKCGIEKPATPEFFHRGKERFGLKPVCKECRSTAKPKPQPSEGCKICTGCNQEFPATLEYFTRRAASKDGLSLECVECSRKRTRQYVEEHRDELYAKARERYHSDDAYRQDLLAQNKLYRDENKDKIREQNARYRQENADELKEKKREEYYRNQDRYIQKSRDWWDENKDEANAKRREERKNPDSRIRKKENQWKAANPDKIRQYKQDDYQRNKEEILRKQKEYSKQPHVQTRHRLYRKQYYTKNKSAIIVRARVYKVKYRARRNNLPVDFTVQDWNYALDYFNGCCAVCGRQLHDLFGTHTAAQDHWMPLVYEGEDNPGTVPTNIVPLCHGENGCNNKKNAKMPDVWLLETYGAAKAKRILERIETYFKTVRQT